MGNSSPTGARISLNSKPGTLTRFFPMETARQRQHPGAVGAICHNEAGFPRRRATIDQPCSFDGRSSRSPGWAPSRRRPPRLGYTASAVSQQMSALERGTGVGSLPAIGPEHASHRGGFGDDPARRQGPDGHRSPHGGGLQDPRRHQPGAQAGYLPQPRHLRPAADPAEPGMEESSASTSGCQSRSRRRPFRGCAPEASWISPWSTRWASPAWRGPTP